VMDVALDKSLDLASYIKDVPDFPKPGVLFKDITPLLGDSSAFRVAVEGLANFGRQRGADAVVSIESRGFLLGSAVASILGTGLIPVRKKGKLPRKVLSVTYQLEYGSDVLEIHEDALSAGRNVLLVDDVLATGGTASAVADLIRRAGGDVSGHAFLVELLFLNGRSRLDGAPIDSLIRYS
jgi:adenine phosphoribosyltransferase